jgi:hypothetical protein
MHFQPALTLGPLAPADGLSFISVAFNWQAVSSVLTLAAVATALWPIAVRYREERAREGHVIKPSD